MKQKLTIAAGIAATLTRSPEATTTTDIDVWYQLIIVNRLSEAMVLRRLSDTGTSSNSLS
jgi:hypothetical protein